MSIPLAAAASSSESPWSLGGSSSASKSATDSSRSSPSPHCSPTPRSNPSPLSSSSNEASYISNASSPGPVGLGPACGRGICAWIPLTPSTSHSRSSFRASPAMASRKSESSAASIAHRYESHPYRRRKEGSRLNIPRNTSFANFASLLLASPIFSHFVGFDSEARSQGESQAPHDAWRPAGIRAAH